MKKSLFFKMFDWVCCSFPILFLISVYVYFLLSWMVLGYRPTPYFPDPKTGQLKEALGILCVMPWYLIILAQGSLILYLLFLPVRKFYFKHQRLLINMAIFACAWAFVIVWARFDPWQIIEWFGD
jgi:hypothetical protein